MLIIYTPALKNHYEGIICRSYSLRSFMRLPNVSSQLYTLSCTQLKNCRLVLCSMFKTIFPFTFFQDDWRIAMSLATGHNRAAFSFQSLEPPAICTFWKTTKKTRHRSFAVIVAVQVVWYIYNTWKSVLYFKTSGKIKSKWPIGGWHWILLESIWLNWKSKLLFVFDSIVIVAWNS